MCYFCHQLQMKINKLIFRMEVTEMKEQTTSIISIILLLLGSILFLVIGFGLISSQYVFAAAVLCFIISAFINIIMQKQFDDILWSVIKPLEGYLAFFTHHSALLGPRLLWYLFLNPQNVPRFIWTLPIDTGLRESR